MANFFVINGNCCDLIEWNL